MNAELVVDFGPVLFIAFVIQQTFVIYAIYIIFLRSNEKNSTRKQLLDILKNRYSRGELEADVYRKLEKDFLNLKS
jgi:uncharacterized membrane protein